MQKGDFVKIDYVGRLESGEIFDLTNEEVARQENIYNEKAIYKPASVIIGAGFVIPGLENALLDMKVGERRNIEIPFKDAFGDRKPELVRTVSEKEFSGQVAPKPGMIVDFASQSRTNGAASGLARGRIQSVSNGRVRVDFNHPLAGKNLKYDLAVVEDITDPKQQSLAVLDFFGVNGRCDVKKPNEEQAKPEVEIETNMKLPLQIKERISSLILEYVKAAPAIKAVKFIEVFEKHSHEHVHKEE